MFNCFEPLIALFTQPPLVSLYPYINLPSGPSLTMGWAPLSDVTEIDFKIECVYNRVDINRIVLKNRSAALKYVNKVSDGLNCNGNMFKDTARIDHAQIYRILCRLNPAKCHPCLHSTQTWSRPWSVIKTGGTFFFSRLELLKAKQNLNPLLIQVQCSFLALQLHATPSNGIGFRYAIMSRRSGTKAGRAGLKQDRWQKESSPAVSEIKQAGKGTLDLSSKCSNRWFFPTYWSAVFCLDECSVLYNIASFVTCVESTGFRNIM